MPKAFLEDGEIRKPTFFKGRSILFKEQGEVLLLRFANDLEDYAKVDQMPVRRKENDNPALSRRKRRHRRRTWLPRPAEDAPKAG